MRHVLNRRAFVLLAGASAMATGLPVRIVAAGECLDEGPGSLEIADQAEATLTAIEQELIAEHARLSAALVGQEVLAYPANWIVKQSDIDEWFDSNWQTGGPLVRVRADLAALGTARQALLAGQMTPEEFDSQVYEDVWDAIQSRWALAIHAAAPDAYQGTAPGEIHFLRAEVVRLNRRLEEEYQKAKDALAQDDSLSDEQIEAILQGLREEQGLIRKQLFFQDAERYRVIRDRLLDTRSRLIAAVWQWRDFAAQRNGSDAATYWTQNFEHNLRAHFDGVGDTPEYSGKFTGNLTFGWADYDWCASRPIADLQIDRDYPDMFVMQLHAEPVEDPGPPDDDESCWVPVALQDQRP